MIYEWLDTDVIGDIIVPCASDNVELPTTKTLMIINANGVGFTLNSGSKICLDIEIDARAPGNPNRWVEFYYGDYTDTSSLTLPMDFIGINESTDYSFARKYSWLQSCPNPSAKEIMIDYYLPKNSTINLVIYNISGRLVKTLANNESRSFGLHRIGWDRKDDCGNSVVSGVYFCRLEGEGFTATKKMILK